MAAKLSISTIRHGVCRRIISRTGRAPIRASATANQYYHQNGIDKVVMVTWLERPSRRQSELRCLQQHNGEHGHDTDVRVYGSGAGCDRADLL